MDSNACNIRKETDALLPYPNSDWNSRDERDQLFARSYPDSDMPVRVISWRLQCPVDTMMSCYAGKVDCEDDGIPRQELCGVLEAERCIVVLDIVARQELVQLAQLRGIVYVDH